MENQENNLTPKHSSMHGHQRWILALTALIVIFIFFLPHLKRNFHTVIPKTLYRSAQLEKNDLSRMINQYHIHSIINLRGAHNKAEWYHNEYQLTKENEVTLFDIMLPAHGLPKIKTLQHLVHLISNIQKPILIHCRQGADRSGLASAIAVMLLGNNTKHDVLKQMSWHYHVASPTSVGYEVFENYLRWLSQKKITFSKESFLQWVAVSPPLHKYHGWFF